MSARPMLCGFLLAACLPATARDTVAPDTLERPPCPSVAANANVAADAVLRHRQAPPAGTSKTRPGTGSGIDGESTGRGPRWHSFLPGMFR